MELRRRVRISSAGCPGGALLSRRMAPAARRPGVPRSPRRPPAGGRPRQAGASRRRAGGWLRGWQCWPSTRGPPPPRSRSPKWTWTSAAGLRGRPGAARGRGRAAAPDTTTVTARMRSTSTTNTVRQRSPDTRTTAADTGGRKRPPTRNGTVTGRTASSAPTTSASASISTASTLSTLFEGGRRTASAGTTRPPTTPDGGQASVDPRPRFSRSEGGDVCVQTIRTYLHSRPAHRTAHLIVSVDMAAWGQEPIGARVRTRASSSET